MLETTDGNEFVADNREKLVRILRHGDDEFVRAAALAALVRYGDEPALNTVQSELDRAQETLATG